MWSKFRGRFAMIFLGVATLPGLVRFPSAHSADDDAARARVGLVEKELIKYRCSSRFDRGRVHLKKVVVRGNAAKAEFEYRITFDKRRIRFDWRGRTVGANAWGGWHRHIVTPHFYIRDYPNGTAVHKGSVSDYQSPQVTYQIFHPRTLGSSLAGTHVLPERGLYDLIGRSDRSGFGITSVKFNGQVARKIDYRLDSTLIPFERSIWMLPGKAFGIVRARSVARRGAKELVYSMDASYQQWGKNKTWFPERIVYRHVRSGRVGREETITVHSAEFGVAVDASVFTVKGLKLKEGRAVSDTTAQGGHEFRWKGGRLRRQQPQPEMAK